MPLILCAITIVICVKTNPRYLNHWANRRCDDLIEVLFTIEEDMFFELMRKEVMLSPKDVIKSKRGAAAFTWETNFEFND